jgi:hypothetical protein
MVSPNEACATKRGDGMWEIRTTGADTGLAPCLWSVAVMGCSITVKELLLKCTCEVRTRPPRCRAWQRDGMANSNEAGFNLREMDPLSRNILDSWEINAPTDAGQHTSLSYRDWLSLCTSPKDDSGYPVYPESVWKPSERRRVVNFNRRLNHPAEFIAGNVGDPHRNVKASSLPMVGVGVGGLIVV